MRWSVHLGIFVLLTHKTGNRMYCGFLPPVLFLVLQSPLQCTLTSVFYCAILLIVYEALQPLC